MGTTHKQILNINVLASHSIGGINQRRIVTEANSRKQAILPNPLADARLVESNMWKRERDAYPIGVSPLLIFTKPGNAYGAAVEYADPNTGEVYYFDVPERFRGIADGLLAVEHGFLKDGTPTFEYCEAGDKKFLIRVPDQSSIILVTPTFPSAPGWRLTEERFSLPIGKEVNPDDFHARFLHRIDQYIGLPIRNHRVFINGDYYKGQRYVIFDPPSRSVGALTLKNVGDQIKEKTDLETRPHSPEPLEPEEKQSPGEAHLENEEQQPPPRGKPDSLDKSGAGNNA